MIRFKIGWILISLTLKLDIFGPPPTRAADSICNYTECSPIFQGHGENWFMKKP